MASSWQTVGADGKGMKKDLARKRKKPDQEFKAVVIEPSPPIEESGTRFSAINQKQDHGTSEDNSLSSDEDESLPRPLVKPAEPKSTRPKAKPAAKKPDKQGERDEAKLSTADILQQLSSKEIDNCFELAVAKHGSVQSSWLRDMSLYFQQKFAKGPREPLDVSTDLWLTYLNADVLHVLKKHYKVCQSESLEAFYATCLDSFSTEVHIKGYPGTYQLLIHTLQMFYPKLVSNCAMQLKPTLETCISRANEALTLLKSVLPCPKCTDVQVLAEGFDLYCRVLAPHFMKPTNVPKGVLKFSMEYLDQLCRSLFALAKDQPLEEVAHFKDLVKFIIARTPRQLVADNTKLVNQAKESLLSVCIAHTHPIPRSSYFREGFVRLSDQMGHEEDEHLKQLVAGVCVACEACRDEWLDLHQDRLKESLILLNHLLQNCPKVKPLSQHLVQLRAELVNSKDNREEVRLCLRYVEELLRRCETERDSSDDEEEEEDGGGQGKRRQTRAGGWSSLVGKLVVVLFFIFVLDVSWNQGWEGSLTCTYLAAAGLRVPAVSPEPLLANLTRSLKDFGVPDNLVGVWLSTVAAFQIVWSSVWEYLFLGGRMTKDLLHIVKHSCWDSVAGISLSDYIAHFMNPLHNRN